MLIQNKFEITVNADVGEKKSIKHHVCKKDYVWNPTTCALEINRYLESCVDDLVIIGDEIIDISHTVSINLNYTKATSKMNNYYILLTLLLVTILLLEIVIICYYFIKHRLEQTTY